MKERLFKFLLVSILVFTLISCGPSKEAIATMTASAWTATPEPTIIPTATPVPYDLLIYVSDSEGQPIEGANITFGKSTIKETNSGGELIFENLSENQGILKCFKQGYILINKDISLDRGVNKVNIELEQDPFGLQLSEVLAEGEKIFFIEDFQDSKEDFDEIIGNWQVIEDPSEDGNMLIDVDQSVSEILAHVDFGSNCPSDVIIEYRFRYVNIDYTIEE